MNNRTLKERRIASVGDNCVDIYPDRHGEIFVGGNGVNLAVAVVRSGMKCSYVGILGTDAHGTTIIEALKKEQVDITRLVRRPGPTAWTKIKIKDGERFLTEEDIGVQRQYDLEAADFDFIYQHDLVHYTAFTNWPTASGGQMENYYGKIDHHTKRMFDNGVRISMDFSDNDIAPLLDIIKGRIEIGFFSRIYENEPKLNDEFLKLSRYGFKLIVITLGAHGSAAYDGRQVYRQAAEKVKVVDTLGAGDAFMGAFLSRWGLGLSISECLRYASQYAALVCTRFGAF